MNLDLPKQQIDLQNSNETATHSPIQKFFAKTTIFVTGATGLLGKLLVEKLLRTCDDLEKIYILVRPKKGKNFETRSAEYFGDVVFDRLKHERPEAINKLSFVTGDCTLPNLGLDDEDVRKIKLEVNCIFHLAATIRFNEQIRKATYINVRATRDLLEIAKKAKSLKAFVHVSTALSFYINTTIEEVFYKPPMKPEDLITFIDVFEDEMWDSITPALLGKWPNTYVFTKAITEDLFGRKDINFPVALFRPAIVTATAEEPMKGWISNYYGATGCVLSILMGVQRTICCNMDYPAEIVPADYVVNGIIAAAWNAEQEANGATKNFSTMEATKVYNYISSSQNRITWREFLDLIMKNSVKVPYLKTQWHRFCIPTTNKCVYATLHYVLHLLPAYIVGGIFLREEQKLQLIQLYAKIKEGLDVLVPFTTRKWTIENKNLQALWEKLDERDKRLFKFNIESIDWNAYMYSYVIGLRLYLLKDPLETVPKAKRKILMFKIAHYSLVLAFLVTVFSAFLCLSK